MESKEIIPKNSIFGVANVETENCRRTIGYHLLNDALTLLLPPTCYECPRVSSCRKEFGLQVIRKYNEKNKTKKFTLNLNNEHT